MVLSPVATAVQSGVCVLGRCVCGWYWMDLVVAEWIIAETATVTLSFSSRLTSAARVHWWGWQGTHWEQGVLGKVTLPFLAPIA